MKCQLMCSISFKIMIMTMTFSKRFWYILCIYERVNLVNLYENENTKVWYERWRICNYGV
ncbi:hypothetical protein KSS87_002124 [Heliosperma pusillum]|nr:hypothetical protein KSS87_002124 [Heliosperma pusillum]